MAEIGDWDTALTQVLQLGERGVAQDVIDNASEPLALTRHFYPAPRIDKGYWPTVCMFWDTVDREIEVFADRYEIYDLSADRVAIDVIGHRSGDQLTDRVFSNLPGLSRN